MGALADGDGAPWARTTARACIAQWSDYARTKRITRVCIAALRDKALVQLSLRILREWRRQCERDAASRASDDGFFVHELAKLKMEAAAIWAARRAQTATLATWRAFCRDAERVRQCKRSEEQRQVQADAALRFNRVMRMYQALSSWRGIVRAKAKMAAMQTDKQNRLLKMRQVLVRKQKEARSMGDKENAPPPAIASAQPRAPPLPPPKPLPQPREGRTTSRRLFAASPAARGRSQQTGRSPHALSASPSEDELSLKTLASRQSHSRAGTPASSRKATTRGREGARPDDASGERRAGAPSMAQQRSRRGAGWHGRDVSEDAASLGPNSNPSVPPSSDLNDSRAPEARGVASSVGEGPLGGRSDDRAARREALKRKHAARAAAEAAAAASHQQRREREEGRRRELARIKSRGKLFRMELDLTEKNSRQALCAHQRCLADMHYVRVLKRRVGYRAFAELLAMSQAKAVRASRRYDRHLSALAMEGWKLFVLPRWRQRMCWTIHMRGVLSRFANRYVSDKVFWPWHQFVRSKQFKRHRIARACWGAFRDAHARLTARKAAADGHRVARLVRIHFGAWRTEAAASAEGALLSELETAHAFKAQYAKALGGRVLRQWLHAASSQRRQRIIAKNKKASWAKVNTWLEEFRAGDGGRREEDAKELIAKLPALPDPSLFADYPECP